jgi:hypothetical protein
MAANLRFVVLPLRSTERLPCPKADHGDLDFAHKIRKTHVLSKSTLGSEGCQPGRRRGLAGPSTICLRSGILLGAKGPKPLHKSHFCPLRLSAACHRHSPREINGMLSVSPFAIWMPGSDRHLSDRKELPDLAWHPWWAASCEMPFRQS